MAPQVAAQNATAQTADILRITSWNIWHGGREDDETMGPQRVVDVIRESNADIIAMQETYGSGERISKALGFHFHPRGTNVSILSRYPVVEDLSVGEEFQCVGGLIDPPNDQAFVFYSIWLPYENEIWAEGARDIQAPDEMLRACAPSATSLKKIWQAIQKRLDHPKYADTPIFIAGDFNSMSHLDYADVAFDQHNVVIDWPTSHVLIDSHFRDSYRETHPFIDRQVDRTWSPRFPTQEQDRIDFIYYRSLAWRATTSSIMDTHSTKFPSDHAAIISVFGKPKRASQPEKSGCRAVSYNIRRGMGTDNKTDLSRAARVLKRLDADFVGLQEVDFHATRSGNVNQAATLGRELRMHSAFGPFHGFPRRQVWPGRFVSIPYPKVDRCSPARGQ